MTDEGLCLRDRIGKAIQTHYPDGMTAEDAVDFLEVLAEIVGEGLASGTEEQVQSFVTLLIYQRRLHRKAKLQPPTTLLLQ